MEWGLVLRWWAVTLLLGVGGWGYLTAFAAPLRDRGFGVSLFFGTLLTGYGVWILGSLGILPSTPLTGWLVAAVVVGGGVVLLFRQRTDVLTDLRKDWLSPVIGLLLFTVVLFWLAWMRSYMPEIEGTEKPADMAFLTGSYTARFFPPEDPWAAGETINYFYFGQYLISFLCKLTGVEPAFGYNIGMAIIFAWTCAAAYSVGLYLVRHRGLALLAPLLVGIIGNLDAFVQKVINGAQGFSWWQSSRVIVREEWINGAWTKMDTTINEFPFWSFILGDLHAHVLAVPLLVTNVALLALLLERHRDRLWGREFFALAGLLAVGVGATPATNYWEVPTIVTLLVIVLLIRLWRGQRDGNLGGVAVPSPFDVLREMRGFLLIGVAALVLYLPFHLNFERSQSDGILFLPWEMQTNLQHFLTVYGIFLFATITFLWVFATQSLDGEHAVHAVALGGGICGLVGFLTNSVPIMLTVGLLVALVAAAFRFPFQKHGMYALGLGALAFLLILVCEYVFIEDWYGNDLDRMNTVFKFHYQAWVFLGLAGAFFLANTLQMLLAEGSLVAKSAWSCGAVALLGAGLLFNYYAPASRTGNWRLLAPTLDGSRFMQRYGGDYAAINYLKESTPPDTVILEATGEAFSNYGRIATFTGRATPLGWGHHQSLWRDRSGAFTREREDDVRLAYESRTPGRLLQVIEKYGISYVHVGHYEQTRYGRSGGLEKFPSMTRLEPVVREGNATLYRVKETATP